jgi:hypothetical protein
MTETLCAQDDRTQPLTMYGIVPLNGSIQLFAINQFNLPILTEEEICFSLNAG